MNDDGLERNPAPERIDLDDAEAVEQWAAKLDVSAEQLHEAVGAVGDLATDVELHLKGTRSTTNADRVNKAGTG